jgi:NADPH2:quinone reductase
VLLVTGASGDVGTASVLLGKSMHLTVVALSPSAEKGAKSKELGVDVVLSPEDQHLRQAGMAAIAPKKVDLSFSRRRATWGFSIVTVTSGLPVGSRN